MCVSRTIHRAIPPLEIQLHCRRKTHAQMRLHYHPLGVATTRAKLPLQELLGIIQSSATLVYVSSPVVIVGGQCQKSITEQPQIVISDALLSVVGTTRRSRYFTVL